MIVFVSAENGGNVFIREGPSRLSPSIKIPAYNYKKYGVLYEVDDIRDNTGVVWYHLRGFGWAMGEFFTAYDGGEIEPGPDPFPRWVVGLDADQVRECITFLQSVIDGNNDSPSEGVD